MKSCDRLVRFPIYRISLIAVSLCLFVGLPVAAHGKDKKLKADELIALHLESIGTAEARQKLESRTYTGQGVWRVVVGAAGRLPGKVSLVSANGKISLDFDTGPNPSFYGEHFAFDGKNPHVKRSFQGGYSNFGNFMRTHSQIMSEGLFGGTINLNWALQDIASRKAKVKYRGLKKIEGRKLHRLDYQTKRRMGNFKVELYFDPETYHHVQTDYRYHIPSGIGQSAARTADRGRLGPDREKSGPDQSAGMQDTKIHLTEIFENPQPVDGISLPARWTLRIDTNNPSRGGQASSVLEMELSFQQVVHNLPIDEQVFKAVE